MQYLFIPFMLFSISDLYACTSAYYEDINRSKQIPLISGVEYSDIIVGGDGAAITICKTQSSALLIPYDHVFIVFEIKENSPFEGIRLFSVHLEGDSPKIVEACDTLIGLYRAKMTFPFSLELADKNIDPISSREVVFIVERSKAVAAINMVERTSKLTYSLFGGDYKTSFNCCTYSDRILKEAGIDTGFSAKYSIMNANNFINCCKTCEIKPDQKRIADIQDFEHNPSSHRTNDLKHDELEGRGDDVERQREAHFIHEFFFSWLS